MTVALLAELWAFAAYPALGALLQLVWRSWRGKPWTQGHNWLLFGAGAYTAIDRAAAGQLVRCLLGLVLAVAGAYLVHSTCPQEKPCPARDHA